MRYITRDELESLPGYDLIERAISYPKFVKTPYTADGFLKVGALYNMSEWSNWKSSSLGDAERNVANMIGNLKLYKLMDLNIGRRNSQPALFPEGDLLT